MAVFTVLSGPTVNTATGLGSASHAFWDGTNLWVFVLTSTNAITPYSSSDISTFTARTALTLATVHNSEGRNHAVVGRVISSTPVAHIVRGATTGSSVHRSYHSSASFSGTTPTWRNTAAEFQVGSTNTTTHAGVIEGPAVILDSANKPVQFYGWSLFAVYSQTDVQFVNADTGASWAQGTITEVSPGATISNQMESRAGFDLGSGHYICIGDNANATGTPTNLIWNYWNGTTWSANANVFSGSTACNVNDWGACVDSTGKVHVVRRTGATTYEHRIYSGAGGTWGAGVSIPTQASLATSGGLPLVADANGNIYLAVLTASPGTVVYIKYNGTAWDAAWSTLEASSATRAYLTVVPQVVSGQLIWLWTEGSGSPFSIKGEALAINTHLLAASATAGGTATALLTVQHKLAASATAGGTATAALTVQHKLTASATAGGTATAALTWHHALKASATAGGTATATLTHGHALAAAATGGGTATAALTVKHGLSASATAGGTASAQVTVKHPLTASATAGGTASAHLTVTHKLAAAATAGGTATAALTVKHGLVASATAGGTATAHLTIKHPLTATASAGGSATALLTVQGAAHHLSASATAGGTATAHLTILHALSASATSGGTALALLLILHHLAAIASAGGTATAHLTVTPAGPQIAPVGSASTFLTPEGSASASVTPSGILSAGTIPSGGISAAIVPQGTAKGRP